MLTKIQFVTFVDKIFIFSNLILALIRKLILYYLAYNSIVPLHNVSPFSENPKT